ncbi:MAG TPA: DUF1192 domain-containing protein [Caulobacteraceae bacterium]|nr:DUF1192 domain-containing protein [Caulobacteraceae bacterium]
MADEDAEAVRRSRGWAMTELAREDLDLYAILDLEERIAALEAEIARTRSQIERKRAGRAAADAFFAKPANG